MRISLPTVLIILGILLILGALGTTLFSAQPQVTEQPATHTVVQYQNAQDSAAGPLLPHVVTTATKLGQGKKATQGLPTANPFEEPRVRSNDAGTALIIPGSALPGAPLMTQISPLPGLTSGNKPRIKYDIYSWSLGTLAATTTSWIDLAEPNSAADIPGTLLRHANSLPTSARLLLVLPPANVESREVSPLTAQLNPFDAYVVVADVLIPSS